MLATIIHSIVTVHAHLQVRSTGVVNGLDQTSISNTNGVGTKTNDVAMLFVESPLCLDVSLSIVIQETPDIGEFG